MSTTKKKPARKAAKKKTGRKPAVRAQLDEYGLNPRERKFCDLFLSPMPAGRAYEQAGYTAKGASADVGASVLLRNAKVAAYLKEQRRIDAEKHQLERWEMIGFLSRVIRTPVGEVNETNDLAQEVTTDEVSDEVVKKRVKMVGKMDAAKQLCQMLGWNEPEQVKVTYEVVIGPGAHE